MQSSINNCYNHRERARLQIIASPICSWIQITQLDHTLNHIQLFNTHFSLYDLNHPSGAKVLAQRLIGTCTYMLIISRTSQSFSHLEVNSYSQRMANGLKRPSIYTQVLVPHLPMSSYPTYLPYSYMKYNQVTHDIISCLSNHVNSIPFPRRPVNLTIDSFLIFPLPLMI